MFMIYLRHGYGYGIAIVVDVGRWDIVIEGPSLRVGYVCLVLL
jgi:hypothetical protein